MQFAAIENIHTAPDVLAGNSNPRETNHIREQKVSTVYTLLARVLFLSVSHSHILMDESKLLIGSINATKSLFFLLQKSYGVLGYDNEPIKQIISSPNRT